MCVMMNADFIILQNTKNEFSTSKIIDTKGNQYK